MNDTDNNSEYKAVAHPGFQEPNEQGNNVNTARPVVIDLLGKTQERGSNHVGSGSCKGCI